LIPAIFGLRLLLSASNTGIVENALVEGVQDGLIVLAKDVFIHASPDGAKRVGDARPQGPFCID